MVSYLDATGYTRLMPEEGFVYDETTGICTANLPEGTLDVIVDSENLYINEEAGYFTNRGHSYYFIEDVRISENTPELKADFNECTMLPISLVLANGQPIEPATKHWNGTEMGPETGGNCPEGGAYYTFHNAKYNATIGQMICSGVPTYYTGFGLDPETDNPLSYWIPSCNKTSDRWSYVSRFSTYTTDLQMGNIAVSINPGSDPIAMTTSDYRRIDWDFPWDKMDVKGIEYTFGLAFGESQTTLETITQVKKDKPYETYNAVFNLSKSIDNLSLMDQVMCALDMDETDPDWPYFFGILSPSANTNTAGRFFHPASYLFTPKPWTDDTKYRQYLPEYTWGNEYTNYTQQQLGMQFGNSTPFLSTSFWRSEDHDTEAITGFSLSTFIIDLAGTFRTDWDKIQSEVYFNDHLVKDKDTDLSEFESTWDVAANGLGKMRYVLTDAPDLTIDGLQPVNTTEITYDQTLAAWEPPTLTSLLFKNADGKVTNRIDKHSDATIELYAGGTKWNQYWYFHPYAKRYFSQGATTITYDVIPTVEYAPNGSANWQKLDASENITQRSPAYGNHYTIDLSNIALSSENGWYDLRISLTTPDGNTQMQTLSPAFNLADMGGLESIAISDGSENITISYFDLQGRRVSHPQHGQLLIRVSADGATKVRF